MSQPTQPAAQSAVDVAAAEAIISGAECDPECMHYGPHYPACPRCAARALVARGWRPEWQTLRAVADECDTIRTGTPVGEFMPTATAWMRHRADQAEARAAEEPLEQVEGREVPDGD